MAYLGLKAVRDAYIDNLAQEGNVDKAAELNKRSQSEPIFSGYSVHPESEPDVEELNDALNDIHLDLMALRKEIIHSAESYKDLLESAKLRINNVNAKVLVEEERIKDLNAICGNYNEFKSVVTLTSDDLYGSYLAYDDRTFCCSGSFKKVTPLIMNVEGNGYEGNAYVRVGDSYLAESVNTANRNYMTDNSVSTAWEYSRLTMDRSEKIYPTDANFDVREARCSITIAADERFTSFALTSDLDNLIIEDVLTSHDHGSTFQSVMRTKEVHVSSMDDKYLNSGYAYGSGIISFPGTQWLKLVLRSNGATSDKLAFNWKDVEHSTPDNSVVVVKELPSAKRHVIRINNIELFTGEFSHQTTLTTDELIDRPVKSLAIFANEYIPEQFESQYYYCQYILTVNGIDFSVVPLNSDRNNGLKIIRFSGHNSQDDYVLELFEPIKTARLTINMFTEDKAYTPYLSNLKICYGEEATA